MTLSQPDGAVAGPRPQESLVEGLVTDGARGQYHVATPEGVLLCTLRGRLRKELLYPLSASLRQKARRANVKARDPLSAGDRVQVIPMGAGRGTIEKVLPREGGAFTREDPGVSSGSGAGSVTPVAGVDQLIAVFAARDPAPHLGLLDRLLVVAESQSLGAAVCLNKVDLGTTAETLRRLEYYRGLGYPVVHVSAASGAGLPELRRLLSGRTSAFVGPSGVGKSSLLNALEPGLGLKVSGISQLTHKGRHTTERHTGGAPGRRRGRGRGRHGGHPRSGSERGGARTPGLVLPRAPRPFRGRCHHSDCTHRQEPGCAVRAAVDGGELDGARFESYLRLYASGAGGRGRIWRDLTSSRSLVGEGELRL